MFFIKLEIKLFNSVMYKFCAPRLAEVRAVEADITLLHSAAEAAGPAAATPHKPVPLAVLCEQQQVRISHSTGLNFR